MIQPCAKKGANLAHRRAAGAERGWGRTGAGRGRGETRIEQLCRWLVEWHRSVNEWRKSVNEWSRSVNEWRKSEKRWLTGAAKRHSTASGGAGHTQKNRPAPFARGPATQRPITIGTPIRIPPKVSLSIKCLSVCGLCKVHQVRGADEFSVNNSVIDS